MPAISSAPAIQPTRASAPPSAAIADVGREPAEHAQRQADGGQQADQHEVVAGGRDRVHVHVADIEHDGHRCQEGAGIHLALTRLAEDHEDEDCVDEVIGSSHGAMVA